MPTKEGATNLTCFPSELCKGIDLVESTKSRGEKGCCFPHMGVFSRHDGTI